MNIIFINGIISINDNIFNNEIISIDVISVTYTWQFPLTLMTIAVY